MSRVTGIYRDGKVVLDEPVNWPNGIAVQVMGSVGEPFETCVDGSVPQETPEAIQAWLQWFDALEPLFTGEDLARFEAYLQASRSEQANLIQNWQAKIDHLLP